MGLYSLHIPSTTEQVTERLDILIKEIRDIQGPNMHGENDCEVVLIAHGQILRAFVKRWLKYPLDMPISLMLEPGGIGILRQVLQGKCASCKLMFS